MNVSAGYLWVFLATLAYGLSQWVMSILAARMGSQQTLGQLAVAQAIATPVFLLSNMALRPIQATDSGEKYRFSHYFSLRMVTSTIGLLAIIGIAVVFYDQSVRWAIVGFGVLRSVESISDVSAP
jgi:O-antigen/teichoic acid export membrane protein